MNKEELKPIDVSKYEITETGQVLKMTKKQEFRKQTEEAKFEAFSFMCKKVAELEEKLKHAEENCINKTCVVFKDKEDCVAKILELENKNAELKEKLTAIRNAKDKYDMSKDKSIIKAFGAEYTLFCDLERILEDWQEDDQLTKAKELLKQWVELYKPKLEGYPITPIQEQTEQFLNSEVEK